MILQHLLQCKLFPDIERLTAAVRSQLDEAAFQSAWEAGQAMTLDEAVVYALEKTE